MSRRSIAFTILAFFCLALTIPEPSLARAGVRPAFAGAPFRIALPSGRRGYIAPHGGIARATLPAHVPLPGQIALPGVRHPVARSVALGARPFRMHRHRSHGHAGYGIDAPYLGAPYAASAIAVYGPVAADDDALAPDVMPPRLQGASEERGCRAEQIRVPNAAGSGTSAVRILRC